MIEGSYGGSSLKDAPLRPDVRVAISPHDALGLLLVEVALATTLWTPRKQSVTRSSLRNMASSRTSRRSLLRCWTASAKSRYSLAELECKAAGRQ
jgi:hypothetical protein